MSILVYLHVQGVPPVFDPPAQPKLQGALVAFVYYLKYNASKVMNPKFHATGPLINM